MKKAFVLVGLMAVIAGCSSSNSSDPNVDAWTKEVRVMTPDQVADRQYEDIGGIEEQEPIVGYNGEARAIESAKSRMRRQAAEIDADAVIVFECGRYVRPVEDDPSLANQPKVVCHGIAIRWLD
jgi:hypothetical protein